MNIVENLSSEIVKSLEDNNINSYKHYRDELIIKIADQDFFNLENIGNYFIVGKALSFILDDMYQTPPLLYKRVVMSAVYCLLKTIISDKNDKDECTAYASALLYILFSENGDFIGGEYMMSKLRNNAEAAAYQVVGMQSVFYWKYKLSHQSIQFPTRIEQRLTCAISPATSKIPDENTRRKVTDFEYDNFSSLLEAIPIDIAMRYHGVFIDPLDDAILVRLKSVFKPKTSNFLKEKVQSTRDTEISDTTTSTTKEEKGINSYVWLAFFALTIIAIILAVNW